MDLGNFTQISREYQLHTCKHCQTFIIDISDTTPASNPFIKRCTFRTEGKQVFEAAAENCNFFKFCASAVRRPWGDHTGSSDLITEDIASLFTLVMEVMHEGNHPTRNSLVLRVEWRSIETSDEDAVQRVQYPSWFDLNPENGACAGKRFSKHAVHPVARSPQSFSASRTALIQCLDTHAECIRTTQAQPPARLIDVQDPSLMTLVSTSSLRNPDWAALSYCWGGPQKAKTTSQNVNARISNIELDELPPTLRDAIFACRQLRIPYLWIDSICIIQDDDDDKVRELSIMSDIYQGAVLTLSASCSSSCEETFLHDRQPENPGVAFPLKYSHVDYSIVQVASHKHFIDEPIDKRGWTFQEQALSERILDYGSKEYRFLCRKAGKEDRFGLNLRFDNKQWIRHAEEYSVRRLTFLQDRLNAIAGVASRFAKAQSLQPSEYLAGLWKPTILLGLLWKADRLWPEQSESGPWIAPSWSWASIPGPVSWNYDTSDMASTTAKFLNAEIELEHKFNPFGTVKSGRLLIKGPLTQTTLATGQEPFSHPSEKRKHRVSLSFDNEKSDRMTGPSVLWLLEFVSRVDEIRDTEPRRYVGKRRGLILQQVANGQCFMRIGRYQDTIPLDGQGRQLFPNACEHCMRTLRASNVEIKLL